MMESLFETWGKKNPEWEKKYADILMEPFTEYGRGTNQYSVSRGKIFGAGYEMFIIGFFIGLYFNKTKKLPDDKAKRKHFGHPIMFWGSQDGKGKLGRTSYKKIQDYMFVALIAKTNIDFIALEKGEMSVNDAAAVLIDKMEEYANYGFHYLEDLLEDDPNSLFRDSAFLKIFTSFLNMNDDDNDEPETFEEDEIESFDSDVSASNEDDVIEEIDVSEQVKLQKEQENEEWSDDEIDRLKFYFEHGFEIDRISERTNRSVYSVKFQLSLLGLIDMPLDVTIENTDDSCCIKNIAGEKVFEDDGKLIIAKEKIYRLNFKTKCTTIKEVKKGPYGWAKGRTAFVVYTDAPLYDAMSSYGIESIQEIEFGDTKEQNKIKVHGVWYNVYGDPIA